MPGTSVLLQIKSAHLAGQIYGTGDKDALVIAVHCSPVGIFNIIRDIAAASGR